MRKPGEEIPAGSLPLTYAVDMSTSVARQVRAGVGARAGIPSSAAERKAPPAGRSSSASPERRENPALRQEVIPEAEPIPETIPSAEPVEERIPSAEPVEERIPSAEPVEDDIPLAEPVVCAGSRAVVKGGAGLRWN